MQTTMRYASALMLTSVVAMVMIVCFISKLRYSSGDANQSIPYVHEGSQLRTEIHQQQLQIDELNNKLKDMQFALNQLSKLSKSSIQPLIDKQAQRPVSAQNLFKLKPQKDQYVAQQISTRTKTLASTTKTKQQKLSDSNNEIPVNLYAIKDKGWTKVPELCKDIPRFQSARLNTMSGLLDVFIHDPQSDKWVSGALANGQIWESGFVNLVLAALRREQTATFLDIGANLGIYSLFAAKEGFVAISVEPLLINVQRICSSVRAGMFSDKMTIIRSALSDISQNVTLGIDVNNVGGSFVVQDSNKKKVNESVLGGTYADVVTSTTLDNVLNLPGFNSKRVIMKIDVEGYEHKVLSGGKEFFSKISVPTILMEWEFHKGTDSGNEIINFFMSRNYTAYDPYLNNSLQPSSSKAWPHDVVWRKFYTADESYGTPKHVCTR